MFLNILLADKNNFGYPVPTSISTPQKATTWYSMSNVGYLLTNTEVIDHGNILYAIELYGHTAGEIRLYVIFFRKNFILFHFKQFMFLPRA